MSSLREAKNLLLDAEKKEGKKRKEWRRRFNNIVRTGKRQRDIDVFIRELKGGDGNGTEKKPTFTEEDYNNGDGFQTYTWGPLAWTFLHIISMNYTPGKRKEYENYLNSLQEVLPCQHCRTNFSKNIEDAKQAMINDIKIPQVKKPDDVYKDRKTFSHFIWYFHHVVNIMLKKYPEGKEDQEPTFDEVRDMFETFRSRCLTEEEIKQLEEGKEGGCTAAIYGADAKAKCTIKFEPRNSSDNTKTYDLSVKSTRIGRGIKIHKKCKVVKREREE